MINHFSGKVCLKLKGFNLSMGNWGVTNQTAMSDSNFDFGFVIRLASNYDIMIDIACRNIKIKDITSHDNYII